jgi:hypothetical protein
MLSPSLFVAAVPSSEQSLDSIFIRDDHHDRRLRGRRFG